MPPTLHFLTCITVFPVAMIGYMSNTCRLAMSSGNRAYTTRAACVSASDSTRILPIRIDRQQSRRPCKKKKLQSLQSFSRIAEECYLLHGLSRAHDRHATVSGAILEPIVDGTGRRHHGTVRVGQLVEAFLDHEPNQPVGVELKVTARCVSKIKQSQTETTRGVVGWW